MTDERNSRTPATSRRARRLARLTSLVVFLTQQTACAAKSPQIVGIADLEQQPAPEEIQGVVTLSGERIDFDFRATAIRNDTIHAFVDHEPYAIGLDQVAAVRVERVSAGRTLLQTLAAVALPIAAAALFVSFAGPL